MDLDTAGERSASFALAYRPPLAWTALVRFLTSRGASAVECLDGARYLRSLRLGTRQGWIAVQPAAASHHLRVEISSTLMPMLTQLRPRLRRLFDLDAQPALIEAQLGADARLAPLLRQVPGLRIPGAVDGFELALRAVLGQQVSVKAATTLYRRCVDTFGEPLQTPHAAITRLAPHAEAIAQARVPRLTALGLTRRRAETVRRLAIEVAAQRLCLDPGAATANTVAALQEIPGIGPWTAHYVAMRALGDADAFPHADLGLLRALGLKHGRELQAVAEAWRPWRAYAALHLWNGRSTGG